MNIAAAILAGIILVAGALKALPVVWSFVKAAAKAPVILERVVAEFDPNGGSSMRDAINRIEHHHGERLTRIESDVAMLTQEVTGLTAGAVVVATDLAASHARADAVSASASSGDAADAASKTG